MIIQIRGTSGSGKSTAMRRVMEAVGSWEPRRIPGRKQPLYYSHGSFAVLGHYESSCGGGDTIGSAPAIYKEIQSLSLEYEVVLVEGLLLSEDVKWSSRLPDLRVLFLTTPLEKCLTNVRKRRAEAGNEKELNPYNTENRLGVIERARLKLMAAGVYCRRCSVDNAPGIVLKWLSEVS